VSTAAFQPIAADDVAAAMADAALAQPANGVIEIAGADRVPMVEIVGQYLKAKDDTREIIADARAPYFGLQVDDRSLVPVGHARIGAIRYQDWLRTNA